MKKLTNPQSLNIDLLKLDLVLFDGIFYRVFSRDLKIYPSLGCQCFKDCNCNPGETQLIKERWYRKAEFDNTDKCFYSSPKQ
jgi:hypothetical protein